MKSGRGFTLLELMVTLAVAAILIAVGAPALTSTVRQNRAVSEANNLVSLLTLARSEAIKRNRQITMCKTADGTSCSTSPTVKWNEGALIFMDLDCDETLDTSAVTTDCNGLTIPGQTETVIRSEFPYSKSSTIDAVANLANSLSYQASGLSNAQAGSFKIKIGPDYRYWRKVVLNLTGRARVEPCPDANC